MSLLPKHHDEFKTVDYWNKFFEERGQEAFEWYGSFTELRQYVNSSIGMDDKCLMIGCGNSDFSTNMYDSGRMHVTNIDFSEPVIEEMRAKTLQKKHMQWEVMDMTAMTFADESFDCVFDKGALDALMSNDSEESREAAAAMFREIKRVLKPGGKYICVTLAEMHICNAFFDFFGTPGDWTSSIQLVESDKPSPFRPFYIVAGKNDTDTATATKTETGLVHMHFSTLGAPLPAQNCRKQSPQEVCKTLPDLQDFFQKQFDLGRYRPGRFEQIDLWSNADETNPSPNAVPRFSVTVVDAPEEAAAVAQRSFVVFMVPRGREAEFQFSSHQGISELAEQASTRRILAVACNRPHAFPDQNSAELRDEINPVSLALRPHSMPADETIPIMAIDTGPEWLPVHVAASPVSGDFMVEEIPDDKAPGSGAVYRRMVFLQSQNFIQTEVRLVPIAAAGSSNSSGAKGGGRKGGVNGKKKGGSKGSSSSSSSSSSTGSTMSLDGSTKLALDVGYMDDHHCAALAALSLTPDILARCLHSTKLGATANSPNGNGGLNVHRTAVPAGTPAPTVVVVGIAGGALLGALQYYLPLAQVLACDIDAELPAAAERFFGFAPSPRCHVRAQDGLDLLRQLHDTATGADVPPPVPGSPSASASASTSTSALPIPFLEARGSVDLLFIDADCKDVSLGMSAPPPAFVTDDMLRTIHAVLSPGGIVVFNVVARVNSEVFRLADRLRDVFCPSGVCDADSRPGAVGMIKASSETVNINVIAIKSRHIVAAQDAEAYPSPKRREEFVEDWLHAVGLKGGRDPLTLLTMHTQYQTLSV
jgi:SAM-dependent methyltransferase